MAELIDEGLLEKGPNLRLTNTASHHASSAACWSSKAGLLHSTCAALSTAESTKPHTVLPRTDGRGLAAVDQVGTGDRRPGRSLGPGWTGDRGPGHWLGPGQTRDRMGLWCGGPGLPNDVRSDEKHGCFLF